MKAHSLAFVLLTASAGSALSADLAARPYTKAPARAVASVYEWSGFYIGLNGGGAFAHKCWDLTGANFLGFAPVNPAVSEGCHDATGGIVGGQIGYRWQAANWVFGLEAQGDWADLKGSNLSSAAALIGAVTNRSKVDALGLFTGQVGYAFGNALWYVKGGVAVANDKYEGIVAPAGLVAEQASETRWGAVVGTGIDFAFAPNWSVGVEYDHMFMGTRSVTSTTTPAAPPAGIVLRTDNIKQDVDMATVRVNYRFGGPVVAKY